MPLWHAIKDHFRPWCTFLIFILVGVMFHIEMSRCNEYFLSSSNWWFNRAISSLSWTNTTMLLLRLVGLVVFIVISVWVCIKQYILRCYSQRTFQYCLWFFSLITTWLNFVTPQSPCCTRCCFCTPSNLITSLVIPSTSPATHEGPLEPFKAGTELYCGIPSMAEHSTSPCTSWS